MDDAIKTFYFHSSVIGIRLQRVKPLRKVYVSFRRGTHSEVDTDFLIVTFIMLKVGISNVKVGRTFFFLQTQLYFYLL